MTAVRLHVVTDDPAECIARVFGGVCPAWARVLARAEAVMTLAPDDISFGFFTRPRARRSETERAYDEARAGGRLAGLDAYRARRLAEWQDRHGVADPVPSREYDLFALGAFVAERRVKEGRLSS